MMRSGPPSLSGTCSLSPAEPSDSTATVKDIQILPPWLQDELAEQAGIDQRFLNVLSKIRQKDQSIYDSTAQLYPESESDPEEGDGTRGEAQPSSKARLKDVLAKQVGDHTAHQ